MSTSTEQRDISTLEPSRKNFPEKDGWIKATLTLASKTTEFGRERMDQWLEVMMGLPAERVETSGITRNGAKVTFCYRERKADTNTTP